MDGPSRRSTGVSGGLPHAPALLQAPGGLSSVFSSRCKPTVGAPPRSHEPVLDSFEPGQRGQHPPQYVPAGDLVWLRMPAMVVSGVLTFAQAPSRADILAVLKQRLPLLPRFSQRLVQGRLAWPRWEADPTFEVGDHLDAVTLAPQASPQQLFEALASRPLDLQRPPWDMTLVTYPEGHSALFVRVHHVIADGRGLMEALLTLDEDPRQLQALQEGVAAHLGAAAPRQEAATVRARAAAALQSLWFALGMAAVCLWALLRFAGRRCEPNPTCIKHATPVRALKFCEPIGCSVVQLKAAARTRGGGTINDVLLAAIAGALRTYMLQRGATAPQLRGRALQPVYLWGRAAGGQGNNVGIGLCAMPLHLATDEQRYAYMREQMLAFRASKEPYGVAQAARLLAYLPGWVTRTVYRRVTNQAVCFVSNVHGPAAPTRLGGHPIAQMDWFGPRFGNVALSFLVLSYQDRLSVGIAADAHLIEDIDALRSLVVRSLPSQASAQAA
jgi:diacylglycerol O-acyltransferase